MLSFRLLRVDSCRSSPVQYNAYLPIKKFVSWSVFFNVHFKIFLKPFCFQENFLVIAFNSVLRSRFSIFYALNNRKLFFSFNIVAAAEYLPIFAALYTTFYGKLFLPTIVILFLSCKCFEDYEWTTLNLKLCFSKSLFDWVLALGLLLS